MKNNSVPVKKNNYYSCWKADYKLTKCSEIKKSSPARSNTVNNITNIEYFRRVYAEYLSKQRTNQIDFDYLFQK